jgi:hypothetical protein
VFDFPRIVHDPMNDMMFLTTTDRGEGTDLSDVHVFGAMNTANPTWVPYPGLPGDESATMIAPEAGVNYVKGTRNLWYAGAVIPQSGLTYTFKTYVTTDLNNWTLHPYSPQFSLPALQPNEDTGFPDCYYGHNLIDLDALDEKVGMTHVGTPDAFRRPNGSVDYDPDILFAALDAPSGAQPTDLTLKVRKTEEKIKVSGLVTNVPDVTVIPNLYKVTSSGSRLIANKEVQTDDLGKYKASFNRPKKGRCRVEVIFEGDATHEAASASKGFSCKL